MGSASFRNRPPWTRSNASKSLGGWVDRSVIHPGAGPDPSEPVGCAALHPPSKTSAEIQGLFGNRRTHKLAECRDSMTPTSPQVRGRKMPQPSNRQHDLSSSEELFRLLMENVTD